MQPKFLLTTLFLIVSFIIYGQNRKVRFTPKVGISYNAVQFHSGSAKFNYKFSPLLVGVETSFDLTDKLELATDLQYIRKGTTYEINNQNDIIDYIFDYIIISPNLKFQPLTKIPIDLVVGVYGGLSTFAEANFSNGQSFNNKESDNFKNFDLGLNIGLSKKFKLKNTTFLIEPRYQFGVIRFSYSMHSSIQLMFGIQI